jgi:hypothetical protein
MAIVYAITKGCYSDYHICAVTLDKEKAKRLCKLFDEGDWHDASVEEFDTETHADLLSGRKPYRVSFRKNGDLYSVDEDTWGIEYFESEIIERPKIDDSLLVKLYAEDKESAIKIAAEKRAKYLAEKEGIA